MHKVYRIQYSICRCCYSTDSKLSLFCLKMSLSSASLILLLRGATTVQLLNSHPVLEAVRIELLDPHMPGVSWVICEAQWQAADIKVFISFPQFTIYSA